jgi:hypothetical protein
MYTSRASIICRNHTFLSLPRHGEIIRPQRCIQWCCCDEFVYIEANSAWYNTFHVRRNRKARWLCKQKLNIFVGVSRSFCRRCWPLIWGWTCVRRRKYVRCVFRLPRWFEAREHGMEKGCPSTSRESSNATGTGLGVRLDSTKSNENLHVKI